MTINQDNAASNAHDFNGLGIEAATADFNHVDPASNDDSPSFDDHENLAADIGFEPSCAAWNEYRNAFIAARAELKAAAVKR